MDVQPLVERAAGGVGFLQFLRVVRNDAIEQVAHGLFKVVHAVQRGLGNPVEHQPHIISLESQIDQALEYPIGFVERGHFVGRDHKEVAHFLQKVNGDGVEPAQVDDYPAIERPGKPQDVAHAFSAQLIAVLDRTGRTQEVHAFRGVANYAAPELQVQAMQVGGDFVNRVR